MHIRATYFGSIIVHTILIYVTSRVDLKVCSGNKNRLPIRMKRALNLVVDSCVLRYFIHHVVQIIDMHFNPKLLRKHSNFIFIHKSTLKSALCIRRGALDE